MVLQTSRVFCSLLAVAVVAVLIISWEDLSTSISWTPVSGHRTRSDEDSLVKSHDAFWEVKGGRTPPPPAVPVTTQEAKTADSTKTKPTGSTRGAAAETPMPVLLKASFQRLPQWEFEDVYNQDAAPRQMTCARSLRRSEDQSFKEAFLPNIRLFLHKDGINVSEWNRLSHFNNPFGFMEYRYDDVMASVKLIPKPTEPLVPPKPGGGGCVRCAVVGTAGILDGAKMGKEIDAHDYVFRMNGAIVKGYEEDVGNRTSVYVHTAHSITTSLYMLKNYGYTSAPHDEGIKYVLIPEGMRDFNWLEGLLKGGRVSAGPYHNKRPRTYYGGQFNESRFYVLHPDFFRYVRNRFLKSAFLNQSYWALVRPTNGAFTLFLALHTCDTVSAYGFMTDDYKKYSNYYVEKKVKTEVIFYVNHDYILEKDTWKRLHDSGIMWLYQRTDSDAGTEQPERL